MIVVLVCTTLEYSFQTKDEAYVDVGTALTIPKTGFSIVIQDGMLRLQPSGTPFNQFPPVLQYPIDRIIIIDATRVA